MSCERCAELEAKIQLLYKLAQDWDDQSQMYWGHNSTAASEVRARLDGVDHDDQRRLPV